MRKIAVVGLGYVGLPLAVAFGEKQPVVGFDISRQRVDALRQGIDRTGEFTKDIIEGKPIKVFNYGKMKRDFTYIDDVVEGVVRLLDKKPEPNSGWDATNPDPATSSAPYRIYNVGNNQPVELSRFIAAIESALKREAQKEYLPLQAGDVPETYAAIDDLFQAVGFKPVTPIEEGIEKFVVWYKDYYGVE